MSFSTRMLQELVMQGRLGFVWFLGQQQFGVDYQATRDQSVDDASLYSYKFNAKPVQVSKHRRSKLALYTPYVFGEVGQVETIVRSASYLRA
jgi:hypothetical protein